MHRFKEEHLNFLEELLITPSPTGFEAAGQKVWVNYLDQYADDTSVDAYGSAVAKMNVNYDVMTVMLEAHCDEIGMMVRYISDEGFIYVDRIGGSDPTIARAKRVQIHTRKGIVSGVFGNTAIHLRDNKYGGNAKQPAWKDNFIDIGVGSKEEALELIQVGDPVTFADQFEFLSDEIITGRAIDNRIGGFIIARVMEELKERKNELKVNVMALNSVQEEIGGFGARMMSYKLMPEAAIVTDVSHATDTPGIDNKEHGLVKMGNGPSVTHGAGNHPQLVRLIEDVSKNKELPIQHEATSARTGTDTDSIYHMRGGIPSALISLPIRYMHSPVETASLEDVQKLIDLMVESVVAMEPDQSFTVM